MPKPKPILIIKNPSYDHDTWKTLLGIADNIDDYHVIVVRSNESFDMVFECFYEKDFNEVKFEELKKIIKDAVS